ncbi:MAG: hypothetical protein GEV08_05600 [Acidimicrobiia bacterium]|nr:hypothetical protein [Acidimicrobiia bacterium]
MDAAKSLFLFGTEDPGVDVDDDDELAEFFVDEDEDEGEDEDQYEVEDEDGAGRAVRALLLTAIATQVRDDDPPEVWANAQRLLDAGLGRRDVLDQMALVASYVVDEAMADENGRAGAEHVHAAHDELGAAGEWGIDLGRRIDLGRYRELLGALPLADVDALARSAADRVAAGWVVAGRVAAGQGMALDDLREQLVAEASAGRGGPPELAVIAAEAALGELGGRYGELALVAGRRVVHLPTLFAGIVLTHRLDEEEARFGEVLYCVGDDLAPFAWRRELSAADGTEVEPFEVAPGRLGWIGPERWAEGEAGDLVAVRVDEQGVVLVEGLEGADLATPDELVTALRQAYDATVAETRFPVLVTDLVNAVQLAHPAAFAEPVAPIVELCAAAGLERDGGYVADDRVVWRALHQERQSDRVHAVLGWDHARAHRALAVLSLVEEGDVAPAELRAALGALGEEEMAQVVLDELVGGTPSPSDLEAAAAWSGRLVDVARRPTERMVARWLAGVIAEEAGDALGAERHFKAAFEADGSWGALVDRVAWYASDRGEAARAAQLWRLLASPDEAELAIVEEASGPAAPKVGRNDLCWCGSGRKSKACHRGQSPRPALEERAGWLYQKAVGYLARQERALDDVTLLAYLCADADADAGGGGDDAGRAMGDVVGQWGSHPLVVDGALAERGWFDRFLEARRALLPDDEADLAGRWLGVGRGVFQVESLAPSGRTGTVRALATGDRLDVVGLPAQLELAPGAALCGRALPVGGAHLVAGAFVVPAIATAAAADLCAREKIMLLCGLAVTGELPPALV